jgi:hypothetical protein
MGDVLFVFDIFNQFYGNLLDIVTFTTKTTPVILYQDKRQETRDKRQETRDKRQ